MSYCAHCGNRVETGVRFCPSCGNPPSGASLAQGQATSALVIAVVVVGLVFFMVALTGIVAAILIPNLLDALQKAKQKRSMGDMRAISAALENYALAVDSHPPYPDVDSMDELAALLEPEHIPTLPRFDGWRREFRYGCRKQDPTSRGCDQYRLGSAGSDGFFEWEDLWEYPEGATQENEYDRDIVYTTGRFIQWPERFY